MSLKAILKEDDYNELDEPTRQLYKEDDSGAFALDVEGLDEHPTVAALRNGHRRSKQERDDARKKANKFESRFGKLLEISEDLDLSDADEDRLNAVLPFLTGERELPELDEHGKPKHQGKEVDLDKIKENARKPLARELETTANENKELKSKLNKLVTDSALSSAIADIKVAGPYGKAVKAMFRDKVKISEDDDGNPLAIIEGEYGEQPVAKYLKEWAQTDEGKAFIEADPNTGGGTPASRRNGGKIKNPWSKEDWSPREQGRIYKEHGAEVAKRMAAEHGKRVL